MNEDKLKIILLFKKFFLEIYEILLNCDRKHLELKRIVLQEYDIYLKDLYLANDMQDEVDRKRKKKS